MTNYEYLKENINDKEKLAHFLCGWFDDCTKCPANNYCSYGTNGWKRFLDVDIDK